MFVGPRPYPGLALPEPLAFTGVMSARPNILIFMTDQQRGATVLPGSPVKAVTPHLDRFREEAVTFSQAYCPSPHCCPSRATFFTGLYPSEHGVWNNVAVGSALSRGPRAGIRFWSEDLAEAGYRMRFAGKWHISHTRQPREFGWRDLNGRPGTPMDQRSPEQQNHAVNARERAALNETPADPPSAHERQPGEIVRPGYRPYIHYGEMENPFGDGNVTDLGLQAIADLAREDSEDPWCLYVGTLGPHDPYFPPERFLDLYPPAEEIPLPESFADDMEDKPALYRRTRERFAQLTPAEHREAIRHYLAFCSYEDWLFGRVLDALRASGQEENTTVLYLSDHGDYLGEHGLWTKGLPCFDSAYHIPAIVRTPESFGGPRGSTVDAFISLADFGPTLLEMAAVAKPARCTGRSLLPFLCGDTPRDWRDALHFQSDGNEIYGIQRAVMTREWKLVFNTFDYDELYDRLADPQQMRNLAHEDRAHPRLRELYERLWQFGLAHEDHIFDQYITTALGEFGPGIVPASP